MEQSTNKFQTSDTALAAFIQVEGYLVIGQDYNAQRTTFILDIDERNPMLQELIRLYVSGKASVEPANYLRNYKALSKQARNGGNS